MIPYILNLIDLCFTLHAISKGATELNPLMRNIPFMVVWKVLGVGFFCWLLEKLAKNFRVAWWGRRICTAAFAVVNLWHIANL